MEISVGSQTAAYFADHCSIPLKPTLAQPQRMVTKSRKAALEANVSKTMAHSRAGSRAVARRAARGSRESGSPCCGPALRGFPAEPNSPHPIIHPQQKAPRKILRGGLLFQPLLSKGRERALLRGDREEHCLAGMIVNAVIIR